MGWRGLGDSGNQVWVVRDGFSEKVTSELRPERWGGATCLKSNGGECELSQHNSSKVAMSWAYLIQKENPASLFFPITVSKQKTPTLPNRAQSPSILLKSLHGSQGLNYVLTCKHWHRILENFLSHQQQHLFFKNARVVGTRWPSGVVVTQVQTFVKAHQTLRLTCVHFIV